MGLGKETRFQLMLQDLAKSLASVDNASWDKVKLLYSICPQVSDDSFIIYPYSLDCIIALGTYFIDSKFNHTKKIVPYLLNLLKGLISAKWYEEDNPEVPYPEKFSFCLNTLLSQLSIEIKKDIFIYQSNEIVNVYSSIINDLRNGFNSTDQVKHFFCIKIPIFLGLAQSMMRYNEEGKSYFCHFFPQQKACVGIIHHIKANYESPHTNLISAVCKQGVQTSLQPSSHSFTKKCSNYQLEIIMNIVEIVRSLLSEETLKLFKTNLNKFQAHPSISCFYLKNFNEILKCATMILFRDVLYQHSDLTSCPDIVKNFIEDVYSSVQKFDSVKEDQDEFTYQALKINVLTKVVCLELLTYTVKDIHSSENLCAHATSLLKQKQTNSKVLIINTPYTICCLNVLGILSDRFPNISDECIKSLQMFLSSPSFILGNLYKNVITSDNYLHMINERSVSKPVWFEYCAFKKVQNSAIENLCMSLKSIYQVNCNYLPAFLTKFSSLLFMEKVHPLYTLIIDNVVISLGHISYSIPASSSTILQCFQQRLCRHSIESDIAIIHQLGNMLIFNESMEMFSEALKTFTNVILEVNGDTKKELEHVSVTLFNVADRLQDQSKINAIFIKLLEIFIQAGFEELRNADVSAAQEKQTAKTSQEHLLHIIALLSTKLECSNQLKKQQERLLQDFWLYYILTKESLILESGNDPCLKIIAPNLPTLTSDSLTDHDLREFFYMSSLSKIKTTATKQNLLRTQILTFLKNTCDIVLIVNKLSLPQIIYLHSVCALEVIRIENSKEISIEPLFCYLTNVKLQKDRYGMWQCICKVAEEIFQRFLNTLLQKIKSNAREKILENHAHMLLIYFNNVHSQIRHIADKFLSELIDSFPHLLWSRQVLWSMLDILSVLHYSLMINSNDEISCLEVPNSSYKIYLMDTKKAREEIFHDFVARSREIVSEARKWAPTIINSHLQEYIIQEGRLFPKVHPIWQLRHSAWTLLCSNEISYHETSDVMTSLTVRSRFIGEVSGLLEKSYLSPIDFGKSLAEEVWKACRMKNLIDYQVSLQRATAFAVMEPPLQYEIKQVLAASHTKFFTEETVSTAIHCWYWMCTAHPDFELEFLIEMFEAWQYTLNNRIGLFSEISSSDNTLNSEAFSDTFYPHNIWLEFIIQQISCSKYSCQDKLEIIICFLHATLPMNIGVRECVMNRSIESIIGRFSILSSALSLLQSDVYITCFEKIILRQRIYFSCLDFFCCLQQFPRSNGSYLKQSIDILVKFWHILHSDKKHILKNLAVGDLQESIAPNNESTSTNEKQDNSVLLKIKSVDCLHLYNSFSVDFFKKRKLALCLLAEEIEFLSTWDSPCLHNKLNKIREWQSKFFSSNRSMYDFLKTAWDVSPILAVHLPVRLRHDDRIWKEISRMVLLNPAAVSHIPHAMLFLATSENLQKDCKELIHLLTWAEADPLDILNLTCQNFPLNSYVLQYVSKTFSNVNTNSLVDYIPQLVQLIRYDSLGYMHNLILKLCQKSPLFCHQLLWNLKSNMYNDTNMASKSVLYDKLKSLHDEVTDDLTGTVKVFYNREFDFVDKITELSFEIPKNLKGEERKDACLRKLRRIKVPAGCYLPSSPNTLICEIDYGSGVPLQSKSRTPYLANFLVHKCTYDEVHKIALKVSEMQLAGLSIFEINVNDFIFGSKTWQRTIFKACDDVRQDMLALQTIYFFKQIFQNIGLDVFLYPYKVVAVAPGMGVIECIPNANSRDELGKQTNVGLYDYFVTTFGDEKSARFQEAQRNFIKSVAAYSIVIFLLQIKDRHNGNIMIDDVGHIMHIDFGFMFESSPGGNLGFEPDMKLTEEMVMIMGGRIEAEPFKWFTELCVKAYLAARRHQESIIALITLMLDSGLPCFRGQTIKLLRGRFAPTANDREAADYIMTVIRNSCLNFRTVTYDMLQYLQNSIQY